MPVIIVESEKAEQFIQGSISRVARRCSKIPVTPGSNLTFIEKLQPAGQRTVMTATVDTVSPLIITECKDVRIDGELADAQLIQEVAQHTGFKSASDFIDSFAELPFYGELIRWVR